MRNAFCKVPASVVLGVGLLALGLSYLNFVGMTSLHPSTFERPVISTWYGYPFECFSESWRITDASDARLYGFHHVMLTRERPLFPQLLERVLFLHAPSRSHSPLFVRAALADAVFAAVLLASTATLLAWCNRVWPFRLTVRSLLLMVLVVSATLGAMRTLKLDAFTMFELTVQAPIAFGLLCALAIVPVSLSWGIRRLIG